MLIATYYLPLATYSVGLGMIAPIGELATIALTAKEIKICCQYQCIPAMKHKLEYKLINVTRDKLNISILQITEGGTIKIYKKIHLSAGIGAYHIRAKTKTAEEWSNGFCSYYGICIPYQMGDKIFCPDLYYYTVPRGLSITLNFGIAL